MPSTKTQTGSESTPEQVLEQYRKSHKGSQPLPPLDQLVISILGVGEDSAEAYAALERLRENFVDWNEMRVARLTEIGRILDPLPEADACAGRVREMLNRLFLLRGNLRLDYLGEMKPTEARRSLLDIDSDLPRTTLSTVLFELCPGTTLPLSNEGLAEAKRQGLLSRTGNKKQLQKVIQASLDAPRAAELVQYFELTVLEASSGKTASGKKKKPRRKTAKKKKSS